MAGQHYKYSIVALFRSPVQSSGPLQRRICVWDDYLLQLSRDVYLSDLRGQRWSLTRGAWTLNGHGPLLPVDLYHSAPTFTIAPRFQQTAGQEPTKGYHYQKEETRPPFGPAKLSVITKTSRTKTRGGQTTTLIGKTATKGTRAPSQGTAQTHHSTSDRQIGQYQNCPTIS